jgi:predicted nuclease of predicted toxin-antitoxin system
MRGLGIRIFTDEDVDARLAPQLRRLGYDAVSCVEAGRSNKEISDDEQLQYATDRGRAIVVYNVDDYVALELIWKATERRHHGIIMTTAGRPVGVLLRWMVCHLDTYAPAQQDDVVLWLRPC